MAQANHGDERMRKAMIRTAAAFVATVLFTLQCTAVLQTSARNTILMDADTGEILYEQDAQSHALIASTTKIMTALVVLEHCALDLVFTVPHEAVGIEGSSMYLKEGEQLTIRELLYGLMLSSGNDAAVALALACSDSVEEFVALMNLTADKLSLENTHFENPNGLDGKAHYSSAEDLAKLTAYALKNEEFIRIVSTKNIRIGDRCLQNHNKLLWSMDGCIGVKTGYTRASGRVLVSAAEQDGRRLIAVTICDGNDWQDHKELYSFGFSCYSEDISIDAMEKVTEIQLIDGTMESLFAGEDFIFHGTKTDQLNVEPIHPKVFFQKGTAGSVAGYGAVFLGERKIGEIRLIWGGENLDGTNTEDTVGSRDCIP